MFLLHLHNAVSALLIGYLSFRLIQWFRSSSKLSGSTPPGPRGLPIIGNAYQIPHDRQWLKFDEWIKTYGDVVYIKVTGQPTVILGSVQAANELLDTRGLIYSDRPAAIMAGELVGWNRGLGYSPGPHSPRFREFRRLFQHSIGPRKAQETALLSMQERSTTKLLGRLLQSPDDFMTHVRQSPGELILRLAYGYKVATEQKEDPLVKIAEEAMQGFSRASEPGAFLVDTIPQLKYLPEWFPGAGFKTTARRMRKDLERLYNVPYEFVKDQMSLGKADDSFVSSYLLEKGTPSPGEEELIKAAAASLYSGGADTTPSSLASFILAMTLHPEIQTRAQAELRSLLGDTWQRLPSFEDRQKLPYVDAIVLELLRWNPSVPLGLAHRLAQGDVYRGYYFPKGTIVWANIWSMLHDEKVYPEPSQFRPERYLDSRGALRTLDRMEDPAVIGFGFGRRICPGMFLALNSVFIAVAMILYVFDISKTQDENGQEIVPEVEYDGFISHPRLFKCTIKPRSAAAALLVERTLQDD